MRDEVKGRSEARETRGEGEHLSSSLIPHPSSLSSLLRTFVAIELGEEAARGTAAILERLRRAAPADIKWVDPRNFHLTIKFLGPTRREVLPGLSEALREVAARAAPFELELAGVGAFPSVRRPRVIWLGVGAGSEALAGLVDGVDAACAALGWAREERPCQGHLTLARAREPRRGAKRLAAPAAGAGDGVAALVRALEAERDAAAGLARVNRFVLLESRLHPHGPTYTVIDSFPFGGI